MTDSIHLFLLYIHVPLMLNECFSDHVRQVICRWIRSSSIINLICDVTTYKRLIRRFFELDFCLSSSQPHRGWSKGLPGNVGSLPRVQQHDGNGGRHRSGGGALHPHPALRHVQIPEQGRGLVPCGREPQLHQQLGAVQRHRRQGEASQHRQNLQQEQEEQGQGVLCVIARDVDREDKAHNIDMCTASRWTLFSPFPIKQCSGK